MEGRGRDVRSRHLPGGSEEGDEMHRSRRSALRLEFKPGTSNKLLKLHR